MTIVPLNVHRRSKLIEQNHSLEAMNEWCTENDIKLIVKSVLIPNEAKYGFREPRKREGEVSTIQFYVFSGTQWHWRKLRVSWWAGFDYLRVQMESTSISGNENVRQTLFPKLFVSHNCAFVIDFFLRFRLLLASSPDHRSLLADDIQVIQPGRNANLTYMVHFTSFCIRSGPLWPIPMRNLTKDLPTYQQDAKQF